MMSGRRKPSAIFLPKRHEKEDPCALLFLEKRQNHNSLKAISLFLSQYTDLR